MAQRRAPKPYLPGNVRLSSGSSTLPPCTHRPAFAARSISSWLRSNVTAAARSFPVSRPFESSWSTEALVTSVRLGLDTTERRSTRPPAIPSPRVNCHPSRGLHLGWPLDSVSTLIASPSLYRVSGPRSLRLSWMLLRARLAVMSVYSEHSRATRVSFFPPGVAVTVTVAVPVGWSGRGRGRGGRVAVRGGVACADDADVVPVFAVQVVSAGPAIKEVISVSAAKGVVPLPAKEAIFPVIAVEDVVPFTTTDDVVPVVAAEDVVPSEAHDHVVAIGAIERVVTGGAGPGGGLAVAGRHGRWGSAGQRRRRGGRTCSDPCGGGRAGSGRAGRDRARCHCGRGRG